MRPFLLLVFTLISFADATPFRLEPRLSLPARTEERSREDCFGKAQLRRMGNLGQVISTLASASPEEACFFVPQASGESVVGHFGGELSRLGYREENKDFYPPGFYSGRWAKSQTSVLSFFWIEAASPTDGVVVFAFHNDGSLVLEQVGQVLADSLRTFVEEAKKRPDQSLYLKQTKLKLPLGTLELPADRCAPGITKTTYIDFPLLSCYLVPLKMKQVSEQLNRDLGTLNYEQSYFAEEKTFIASNWVSSHVAEPKLGIIVASASQLEGSILVEVDMEAVEKLTR